MGIYVDVGDRHCYTDNEHLIARRLFEMINMSQCMEELDGVTRIMCDKLENIFADIGYSKSRKKFGPIEYFSNGLCKWGARTILLQEYDIPEKESPEKDKTGLNVARYLMRVTPFLNYLIKSHLGYKVVITSKFNICKHIEKIEALLKANKDEIIEVVETELGRNLGVSPGQIIYNAKEDIAKFLSSVTRVVKRTDNYYNHSYHDPFDEWFCSIKKSPKTIKVPYFTEDVAKGFGRVVQTFGPVSSDYYGKLRHARMSDRFADEADRMAESNDGHVTITFNKRMLEYHVNNGGCEPYDPRPVLSALKEVRDSFQETFKEDPVAMGILRKMGIVPKEKKNG